MSRHYLDIQPQEVGVGSPIAFEILEHEGDTDYKMALLMMEEVMRNNAAGKPTMFILPVGPRGYARRFGWMVERFGVSLRDTTILNMDEYMWDEKTLIQPDHPLSFKKFMQEEFYGRIPEALNVLPQNRLFPDPANPEYLWERIQAKPGGVDICIGGIGIDGHIAFNEPPQTPMSPEAFAALPTRVLPVHYSTLVRNAMPYGGNYDAMPKFCITIGMREILSARRLCFFTGGSTSMIRRVLHGPVTSEVPASLMQTHPDCTIYCRREALEMPVI